MNSKKIAIFVAAIGLIIVAIFSLSDDMLTPYVKIAEARADAGKLVQIIGKLDKTKPVNHMESFFYFSIIDDDNSKIDIVYNGIKPQNFDRADQIVCIGKYNAADKKFIASKLLVKCPSKYEVKEQK